MVRFTALLLIPAVTAFAPSITIPRVERLAAAYSDDFDAPVPINPQVASELDHSPLNEVDDECYLGKYGQHEECVDFDPIHTAHSEATNKKAALEMPDFSKIGDEIVGALKKSPLGKLFVKN